MGDRFESRAELAHLRDPRSADGCGRKMTATSSCSDDSFQFCPFSMQPLYLLHLDRHHLGDALFLKSLAQQLASAGSEAPATVLVHGSGEKVERTLEAQGVFLERTGGLLDVETDEQRRLVERAVREMNQEIVAALTDQVVSAVGIQGVDRGLFSRDEAGRLEASNVGWLSALIKQHVVPVVSALVEAPETGRAEEVRTASAVVALSRALRPSFDPVACVLARGDEPGVCGDDGDRLDDLSIDRLTEQHVAEPSSVKRIVESDVPVMVTSLSGLFGAGDPEGSQVHSS